MEFEWQKIPSSNNKSLVMKKRKEELEFDMELNTKNINLIRHKLRDLKAL